MGATAHPLAPALAAALGAEVVDVRPVSGGDVSEAARVRLADGRLLFVKHHAAPPPGMFAAEARGLSWLSEGPLAVPVVQAVTEDFLVLPWVEPGAAAPSGWEALGRGLAGLHRLGAPTFGGPDGYIATLPQRGAGQDWAAFYGQHRLLPLAGPLPPALRRRVRALADALTDALPDALLDRVGPAEPPARLHGDLWSGNVLFDEAGAPVLIDPAAAGGHRELDLAMMRLFGGFPARCFSAYEESWPLAPGWPERVPLYQLYFLLVHVGLFGAGWHGRVAGCLDQLRV